MLSLIFYSALAFANLTELEPRLSCIDVHVRATCALSHVSYESISDGPTFLNSCVGLTVLVGEGLWPFKRWSSPKILEEYVRTPFLFILKRDRLHLRDDPVPYGLSEIFCPAEAVDAKLLPVLNEQLRGRPQLRVGDVIEESAHAWLVDGLHINLSGYVYATLRDQETGQTIARTLN